MRILLFIFCVVLCVKAKLQAQDKSEFALVRKDNLISLYERWITFPKSDPPIEAREVKGEFIFNNTIYEGLHLIQSESKINQWQNHVSEFKVYKQPDTTFWIEYSYHDIPWPVSDQDHLLEYRLVVKSPTELFIMFESRIDNTLAPVRKGVTRMHLSGSWTLKQIGPMRVKATYRILSKPIGIPKFFTDPVIRSNMMTTIKEFIDLLEHRSK